MEKTLKRIFFVLVVACIPLGFFTGHEHGVSFWHRIPSIDVLFGVLGALLLIAAARVLASFAEKEEDFHD
jgi:hypothetical protein